MMWIWTDSFIIHGSMLLTFSPQNLGNILTNSNLIWLWKQNASQGKIILFGVLSLTAQLFSDFKRVIIFQV